MVPEGEVIQRLVTGFARFADNCEAAEARCVDNMVV